ncbi:MAG: SAM-dependent methyltransferase [bacterium]
MRFSRFLELALYDPLEGYYGSGRAAVGKDGDFFTNVSVGPVFGALLAGQFLEMWEILGRPPEFHLVEQGANDGVLARDVLNALAETPLADVPLILIEPVSLLQEKQALALAGRNVTWVKTPDALPECTGVHFSNELFDALPFDILEARAGAWHELLVGSVQGKLSFQLAEQPIENSDLPARPDGFRTELRRHQAHLFESLASKIRSGFVIAIDYGMSREELLAPHRSAGSFACYSRHSRDDDPLGNPGGKDITAHVDFTLLARDAASSGFTLQAYTDQHRFLVGASTAWLKALDGAPPSASTRKILRSLRTLLHPEILGTRFQAILFSKGPMESRKPSGFQHAGNCNFLWNPGGSMRF